MTKPTKRKSKLRLTAVEIQQLQQAVDMLDGKYGERAKLLLQAVMVGKREEAKELLSLVIASLTEQAVDEFRPPRCGHA